MSDNQKQSKRGILIVNLILLSIPYLQHLHLTNTNPSLYSTKPVTTTKPCFSRKGADEQCRSINQVSQCSIIPVASLPSTVREFLEEKIKCISLRWTTSRCTKRDCNHCTSPTQVEILTLISIPLHISGMVYIPCYKELTLTKFPSSMKSIHTSSTHYCLPVHAIKVLSTCQQPCQRLI